MQDSNKRSSICVIRVPEGEEKEYGAEKVLEETMAENSPNLANDTNLMFKKLIKSQTG